MIKKRGRSPASDDYNGKYDDTFYDRAYNLIEDKEDVINYRKRGSEIREKFDRYYDLKTKHRETNDVVPPRESPFIQSAREPYSDARKALKSEAQSKGLKMKLRYDGQRDFIRKYDSDELEQEVMKVAKRSKSGLKLLGKALPFVGAGMALTAPSADAAVADMLGVESMGVSPEQADLDKQYKQRIRSRQEALNLLPH